jgi:hypothetical protein
MAVDWPTTLTILLGNGVLTTVITAIITKRQQDKVWLKDSKRQVYSKLSIAILSWEGSLEANPDEMPAVGELVAEAQMLMNNPELEKNLELFLKNLELLQKTLVM